MQKYAKFTQVHEMTEHEYVGYSLVVGLQTT